MSTFHLYAWLCGLVPVLYALDAYSRTRDAFHPAIFLGGMLTFLYCFLPLQTVGSAGVPGYLTPDQCTHVEMLNLLGVVAVVAGMAVGSRRKLPLLDPLVWAYQHWQLLPRLERFARWLGAAGVVAFVVMIVSSGGFGRAYGHAYGGFWSSSGYIRESVLLTLPAIAWLLVAYTGRKLTRRELWWLVVLAAPLLIHGLLGARRGPTFMVVMTCFLAWKLRQRKKLRLLWVVTAGLTLGVAMLLLVANRPEIFIGSSFDLSFQPMRVFEEHETNEFVYGAGTILNAEARGRYFWGRRYLAVLFIRPIPRELWPTEYEDASRWLGIPNLEDNMGTGAGDFKETLGWRGGVGAAPGLVADLWIEFSWLALPALFLVGRLYARLWRGAVERGGPWLVSYVLAVSMSAYLIMQTLEAMAFRLLFTVVPALILWRLVRGRRPAAVTAPGGAAAFPRRG